MKVIICGAGQVGWQIARHLSGEHNDVTVVDNNPDLVRRATDTLDVQGIAGFASYPDVLDRAGARDADMIIAATHSDEVNMVTCQVAHSVFSIQRKIARLRAKSYLNAIYSDLYRRDHLPIDVVISPEREVAAAAMQRLRAPAAFDTEVFMDGRAQLLGIRVDEDCPVVNTPLRQLTAHSDCRHRHLCHFPKQQCRHRCPQAQRLCRLSPLVPRLRRHQRSV